MMPQDPEPNLALSAVLDGGIRVHVIATDALPEDSRITRPMIVVHIVDSSTGRYLRRTSQPKVNSSTALLTATGWIRTTLITELLRICTCGGALYRRIILSRDKTWKSRASLEVFHARIHLPWSEKVLYSAMLKRVYIFNTPLKKRLWQERTSLTHAAEKDDSHSELHPERLKYDEADGVRETGMPAGENLAGLDAGGATTTFEERTVWNLTDVSIVFTCVPGFLSVLLVSWCVHNSWSHDRVLGANTERVVCVFSWVRIEKNKFVRDFIRVDSSCVRNV